MLIFYIITICLLVIGGLYFIYLHQMKKSATIVCGIVIEMGSIHIHNYFRGRSIPVTIEIKEDDIYKEFGYRPKSSFFNVRETQAVEFYRTLQKDGNYKYVAVAGYYYYLIYPLGLAAVLGFGILAS